DPIVHADTGPLVLVGVDRERGVEERLFFSRSDPTITLRFLLGANRDPEAVERRVRQERRILESSPVYRPSQGADCTVYRGYLMSVAIRCLEPLYVLRLFEDGDG